MARELWAIALVVACGACRRGGEPEPATSAAPPLASKAFYRLDAGSPATCTSGATCEAHLVLTALGSYHVNPDYPFKFVGDPASAPAVDGDGTFALGDAKHGTLTVTFRPAAAGTAKLVGTFKLSVCNDDTCEIETPRIELPVPVS